MHNLHACGVFGEDEALLSQRAFPAPASDDRKAFERDRDRVVQARAFRRLAGKTQVFTSRASDHFRSRLTHTIEVAQVARQVAGALGLNVDLAETLALVHDIGHPPFGHAGERALDECLKAHGLRFDHNLHALRIVERFEQRYAGHRGLNLTLGAREGIIKHSRDYSEAEYPELAEYFLSRQPPLEAQIIDLADEIAYLTADLDDGVESGLLDVRHIRDHVGILRRSFTTVQQAHPEAQEKYIFHDALYTCSVLEREHTKAGEVVTELFEYWVNEPEELPEAYFAEIESEGLARVVADYIAGMTDNFILLQYADVRRKVRSGLVPLRSSR